MLLRFPQSGNVGEDQAVIQQKNPEITGEEI